ncbi:MAG: alpha/beta hydrolase [bacterium]|nr:alpha/beta hydrolase [bacterium]
MNKSSIIILHGWGLRGSKYQELSKLLENKGYKVYSPDLPGFGDEPLKSDKMNLSDYVLFLEDFIRKNKIISPIIIAHSFGGRVAIKYARNNKNLKQLILTGVPIIRNQSFLKKFEFLTATYFGRLLNIFPESTKNIIRKTFYFIIGEWDYYKSGKLKEVFKNIIGEDLVCYTKELIVPTVLIWGENDKITPSSLVFKIKKINPNFQSIIVPEANHKLPYANPTLFYNKFKSYI